MANKQSILRVLQNAKKKKIDKAIATETMELKALPKIRDMLFDALKKKNINVTTDGKEGSHLYIHFDVVGVPIRQDLYIYESSSSTDYTYYKIFKALGLKKPDRDAVKKKCNDAVAKINADYMELEQKILLYGCDAELLKVIEKFIKE